MNKEEILSPREIVNTIAGKEDEIREMGFASSFLEAIEISIKRYAKAYALEMIGEDETIGCSQCYDQVETTQHDVECITKIHRNAAKQEIRDRINKE